MGSNCCKNALDKVRPPAHATSFDPGEPPDPAAPWPGDTFCRAPPAQAPPAFPEGAFDSLPNQLPDTSIQQADAVASAVRPSGAGSIERRISAPAGSGSTAVSLPESQGQHQRTPPIFTLGEPGRRLFGRPGEDTSYGSSYHRGPAGRGDSGSFGDSTADGTQRLPARLRQALRASSMRLRSRLRMDGNHDEAGRNKSGKDNGDKALLSTGATAATFPDTCVDDTHFVCYPPASTPSSECLSQGWPAAPPPWDDTTCAAAAGDETAAGKAREPRGKRGGSSYIAGACVMTVAEPSRRTSALFPSGVELSADIAGEKGQIREVEEIAKCMNKEPSGGSGGGEEGKRRFGENIVASPASSRKHHGNTIKDQKGLLKRSRGSSAASGFRAAMEVAFPRWKGSRGRGGAKKEERKGRGVVSPPGSSSGGGAEERKKVKKRKNLIFSGEPRCLDLKSSSKKRGTNDVGRTAVRSSHCSSASTAAQEEDDHTTTNVGYWRTTNLLSQQTAQEFTPVAYMEPQGAHDFPFPCGQSSTQQPVITGILRQGQQQLAAPDCAVSAIAGPPTGAVRSSQTGPIAIGRPLAAPRETFLGGESHHAEHRTTTPSLLRPPLAGGSNHSFVHGNAASIGEKGEIGRQQPQQSVMNYHRTEPITSSLARHEAHRDHREHTSGATSSGHGSSYIPRSEDDSSLAAVAAINGDGRRGEQVVMGGGPAGISAQSRGVTSATGAEAGETLAQQERAADNRQQGIDDNVDNASSNLNMPVVTMPFPE